LFGLLTADRAASDRDYHSHDRDSTVGALKRRPAHLDLDESAAMYSAYCDRIDHDRTPTHRVEGIAFGQSVIS